MPGAMLSRPAKPSAKVRHSSRDSYAGERRKANDRGPSTVAPNRRFHPGRRHSLDTEAGYQQPHAFNGQLFQGAAFARWPVHLRNGETIDA